MPRGPKEEIPAKIRSLNSTWAFKSGMARVLSGNNPERAIWRKSRGDKGKRHRSHTLMAASLGFPAIAKPQTPDLNYLSSFLELRSRNHFSKQSRRISYSTRLLVARSEISPIPGTFSLFLLSNSLSST